MRGKKTIVLSLVLALFFALLPAMPAEAAVKISKKNVMIMAGETLNLKVSGTKKDVTWSSNKKSIATVSENGKIKGKKPGAAVITAKVGKKTLKCKVTVTDKIDINDYVHDGVFDYVSYGYAKGASSIQVSKSKSEIGLFFGDWFFEISTNNSPGVAADGVGYAGVGVTDTNTMTYVVDLPFGAGISVGNGLTIPDNSLDTIDKFIDYMKAHPDPNTQPQIDGLTVVPW